MKTNFLKTQWHTLFLSCLVIVKIKMKNKLIFVPSQAKLFS